MRRVLSAYRLLIGATYLGRGVYTSSSLQAPEVRTSRLPCSYTMHWPCLAQPVAISTAIGNSGVPSGNVAVGPQFSDH